MGTPGYHPFLDGNFPFTKTIQHNSPDSTHWWSAIELKWILFRKPWIVCTNGGVSMIKLFLEFSRDVENKGTQFLSQLVRPPNSHDCVQRICNCHNCVPSVQLSFNPTTSHLIHSKYWIFIPIICTLYRIYLLYEIRIIYLSLIYNMPIIYLKFTYYTVIPIK